MISSVAGVLTVQQAFRTPQTETLSKWTIGCVASALAVASVGSSNALLLAQPVYLMTLNFTDSSAIVFARYRAATVR